MQQCQNKMDATHHVTTPSHQAPGCGQSLAIICTKDSWLPALLQHSTGARSSAAYPVPRVLQLPGKSCPCADPGCTAVWEGVLACSRWQCY
jgi:hypothetical protein